MAKKTTTRKTTAKETTPRKPLPKETTTRKATARKPTPRKPLPKEMTPRKATARKPTPRKPLPKEMTASKAAAPPEGPPTAEELAAQGLALLRQALLGQTPADQPQPDPAFGIQALERSLAVLVGERYAARLQRLDVLIRPLEERVFSNEGLDKMSWTEMFKLYRLVAPELYRGSRYVKDLLAAANTLHRAARGKRAIPSLIRTRR